MSDEQEQVSGIAWVGEQGPEKVDIHIDGQKLADLLRPHIEQAVKDKPEDDEEAAK